MKTVYGDVHRFRALEDMSEILAQCRNRALAVGDPVLAYSIDVAIEQIRSNGEIPDRGDRLAPPDQPGRSAVPEDARSAR